MAGGSDFFMQIEAEMKGAAGAVSELQELSESIGAAKAKYADFERATAGTGKALENVGGKIAALREKMSKSAAGGDMAAFWKDGGKLNALVAQEDKLKTKALEAKTALEGQGAALSKMSAHYAKLKTAETGQTKALKEAEDAAKGFQKSGDGLNKMGGPLGRLGQRAKDMSEGWNDLKKNLGTTGAVAAVAVVAIAAVAAALVAGAVAAGRWALGLGNTQRNLGLTLEAMAGSEAGGKALGKTFSDITGSTAIASDRLLDLSRDLKKAKVSAEDMPAALKALALQESALGDSGGTAALIEDLKNGKTSAAAMAKEMSDKFGGIVAKKVIGLDQLSIRLQQNLADLFTGGNMESFLQGLDRIVGLLSASSESGKALRQIVSSMFSGIDWEATFIGVGKFLLGMVIGAQQVYIALLKVSKALGLDDLGDAFKDFPGAAQLGTIAAYALLVPIVAIGAAAAVVAATIKMIGDGVAGLKAAGEALGSLADGIRLNKTTGSVEIAPDAAEKFSKSGKSAGRAFVDAINNSSPFAFAAGKLLGKSSSDGLDAGIERHSPPRLFVRSGAEAAEAYAGALEDGAPAAHDASKGLAASPSAVAASGSKSGGGGFTWTGNLVVNVPATVDDREGLVAQIRREVQDVFEGVALRIGGPSGEPAT